MSAVFQAVRWDFSMLNNSCLGISAKFKRCSMGVFKITSRLQCQLVTSIFCKQHGKQQVEHLSGLSKWMTSFPWLSVSFISKGLAGPQHCLLIQLVSSLALNTCCPMELKTVYLFWVSNPITASSISTFCFMINWFTCAKYSRPGGAPAISEPKSFIVNYS